MEGEVGLLLVCSLGKVSLFGNVVRVLLAVEVRAVKEGSVSCYQGGCGYGCGFSEL